MASRSRTARRLVCSGGDGITSRLRESIIREPKSTKLVGTTLL